MTTAGLGAYLRRGLGTLLLFRCRNRLVDLALSLVVAMIVVWSRFTLLADGPWEWDEVAFARGVLEFDLAAYFPHPPGYPGWLAIGHLLTPLAGGASLVALQWASAAFSVAALWLLAALGRKVASPSVAVAAALAVLAAPGPWLYAERGFTSTAASVLALGAAVVAAYGLQGRRLSAFTLLVAAAFLVRPNLLPPLAVMWTGVAMVVRPWKRLVPGVGLALAAGLAAVGLMARAQGGWEAFIAPFFSHSQRHFSRLVGNVAGYPELGLVKGLGGVLAATLVLVAAAVGLVVWWRRVGRRPAALWIAVLVVAVAQLVWMQNRSYCRYAVGVQMALAPLVAGAAALAPPVVGCTGLLALAGWFGAGSLPLLEEQHTTQLAGWRAVQWAEEEAVRDGRTVVVESELHLFASYLWHLLEGKDAATPPRVLSPWDPGPWAGLEGSWLVAAVHRPFFPDSLYGREIGFGGTSAELRPLTQQRFLDAWVIDDPPLPLTGWWPGERLPGGRRFMWGAAGAELLLPPMPVGTKLGIGLRPAPGPEPLIVELDGREVARLDGEGGEERLWIEVEPAWAEVVSTLRFSRSASYAPGNGDARPLAVQLFEVRALHPKRRWEGAVVHPWQRSALRVGLEGAYGAEDFAEAGEGMWLGPSARLTVPAGPGTLRLRLWAPRPTPPRTQILLAGRPATGAVDVGPRPEEVEVVVAPGDAENGMVKLELVSLPYVPSGDGGDDHRELGVVLSGVRFEPQ
ncbi:MAG: hypothetical protein ACC742_04670 [Thermoanaerobaculales bacterium]